MKAKVSSSRHLSFLDTFVRMKQTIINPFHIQSSEEFEEAALAVFQMQFEQNAVYRSFCDLLYIHPSSVTTLQEIPFLPIDFFKNREVICGAFEAETIFTSSGTTGSQTSKHYVKDLTLYEQSFLTNFELHYGPISEYAILALLPSYLERGDSSLVYMVDALIKRSEHVDSGFYLHDHFALSEKLLIEKPWYFYAKAFIFFSKLTPSFTEY